MKTKENERKNELMNCVKRAFVKRDKILEIVNFTRNVGLVYGELVEVQFWG